MKRAVALLVVAVASLLLLVGIASLAGSTRSATAAPAKVVTSVRSLQPALACTPVDTPAVVATPAFTPGPGCTSVPLPGVLSAAITQHSTSVSALFINRSATCSYPIGLASYQDFGGNIENDTLFDYELAVIPPNSSLVLSVNIPSCDYRAFAFYGSLLTSFAGGVRYNERALDEVTNITPPTSTPTSPPTNTPLPTNTPTSTPTITPTSTATCVPRPTPPPGKVTICHVTGSVSNPYVELTVSEQAAEKHRREHPGDIVPAPACGCPATLLTSTPTAPASTPTVVAPTNTSTSLPATSTSTTVPPTSTSTAVPPSSTSTAIPPTNTSTQVPPTSTNTPVPPTSTRTPVPPTSTPTSIACIPNQTFTGSITSSDPSHINFVNFAPGGPSVCGPTPACPGVISDSSNYHYDTYTFVNTTGSSQCITVTVNAAGCGGGSFGLASYAYLGPFNPASLCTNYAGGFNSQIDPGPATYHFTVPAGQTFTVEVEEYVAGAGCGSYTVTIGSCATFSSR